MQLLRVIGSVAAPTTLLTALLFYFGRLHITAYFGYFGVNFTTFDLTVQDYLIRSADGLFVPMTVAAALVLLAFWAYRSLTRLLDETARRRIVGVVLPAAAIAGLALVTVAALGVIRGDDVLGSAPEFGGLSLAVGVLLLSAVSRALPRSRPAGRSADDPPAVGVVLMEWAVTFVLVSVGLFWAVGSYAVGVGTGRAQQTEAILPSWPTATVYSEKSLNLAGPGVQETRCADPDAAYRFRYEGLKLIFRSGDQYFFLPAEWTSAQGNALLIPRSNALRLEFAHGAVAGGDC